MSESQYHIVFEHGLLVRLHPGSIDMSHILLSGLAHWFAPNIHVNCAFNILQHIYIYIHICTMRVRTRSSTFPQPTNHAPCV